MSTAHEVRYLEDASEHEKRATQMDMHRPGSLVGTVFFAVSEELLRDAKADTPEGDAVRARLADDVRARVLDLLKTAPV